jgi:hypothetical protein
MGEPISLSLLHSVAHAKIGEILKELNMSTILIIVLVLVLLGGGGYGYNRWR